MRLKIQEKLPYLYPSFLLLEALVLLGAIFAFWFHAGGSTGIREHWYWLLWFAVPFFFARYWLTGRFFSHTALIPVLLLFLLLTVYSYFNAPLQRESFLAPMARPLLGIWMVVYMAELGKSRTWLMSLVIATIGLALVLGFVAISTTNWLDEKSGVLEVIIEQLPRLDTRQVADEMQDVQLCGGFVPLLIDGNCFRPSDILRNLMWGFNPNEIAGALAWMSPVMAVFAISLPVNESQKYWTWLVRGIAAFTFLITASALILGQSRFAIIGLILSLILAAFLLLRGKWRYMVIGLISLLIIFQAALTLNLFPSEENQAEVGISNRDESSLENRLFIWEKAIQMMLDNPTTGVGMAMFRTAISGEQYRIEHLYQENRNPPHAHNEWLQIGADLGVLGLILYLVMQGTVIYMLWRGYREGDALIKSLAVASFAGLLAHAVFGLGDAITLWDRFQFILWWLVGLAAAQYIALSNEELSKMRIEESSPSIKQELE